MQDKDLSKEELLSVLHGLQQEYSTMKESYERDLNEHKKVVEELRRSQLYYCLLLDSIPDTAIHLLDPELRYLAIGGGEVEKNNFDKSQIEGKLLNEAFPKEISEIFEPLFKKALAGESTFFEMPYGDFVYSYQILPVKDAEGNIVATMSTSLNMTERNRALEALKESEEVNRLLFKNSGEAILFTNPDGTIYSANTEACKILGRSEEEIKLLGRSGIMDTSYPLFKEALEERNRTGKFKGELNMVRADGTVFPVEISSTIFRDSSGGERTSLMFRDINDRKQVEESLKESRLLLKSSLECQKDTILLSIDKNYKYLFFNKAHLDVMKFAYGKDIAIGMNILDCITSDEDRKIARENYDRALRGETHSNIRVYGENNRAYYESFFNPILNDEKEIIGATGLARNISERMASEQEIKRQNEELQNLIKTKDKFFSIIAHDLRSPFNVLLGLTQVMVEDLPGLTITELQKMAGAMSNSATNLYRLLENLLQWSQIQNGAMAFNPEAIQLESAINEIVGRIRESAESKGIKIITNPMEGLVGFGDTNMFQTVIRNLLSNAVKYTATGGIVRIFAKKVQEGTVELSVSDTGIGMNATMVQELFRIDKQISRTGTNGEPSTGLGLVLCKEFIERQGGKIRVESEEGKGSIFHFTMPLNINH